MALFKIRQVPFKEPAGGVKLEFLKEFAYINQIPDGANIDCDHGEWMFWWEEQMSPEEEATERARIAEEQERIKREEAPDRKLGF